MELILSHLEPAKLSTHCQKDIWKKNLERATNLKIATGYVSADAIIELMKVIEVNSKPHIDLLIGMHYFDKFTPTQYDAVKSLDHLLRDKQLGCIYLSDKRRYHGKMCSFADSSSCYSALVGSSNLSSITGVSESKYEVDCLFEEQAVVNNIDTTISEIILRLGTKISELPPITDFNVTNSLLENQYGVTKVSNSEYADILSTKTEVEFDIPAKTAPKSNLNVFFGKGRENTSTGFIMPRPWYEVELIVSNKITRNDYYPKGCEFTVYTDDHWSFKCSTNGDYSKNFRSADDLKILGRWIKGRLEASGALKIGTPVTAETLEKYGNDKITLSATRDPNIWLLNFIGR